MLQVTFIMCADHPRCATATKVVVLGGVKEVVNHAKFHRNQFKGIGYLRCPSRPICISNLRFLASAVTRGIQEVPKL